MFASWFRRLARDADGAVAVLFAVLAIAVALAVGTGVDYGRSAEVRAMLQRAVDAAALAGASVYTSTSAQSTATALAQSYVSTGTASLPSGATVTKSSVTPGTSGSGSSAAYTMSASVTASVPTTFMSLYEKTISVSASATAKNTAASTGACILVLNPSAAKATVLSSNSAHLTLSSCGIAVNSSSSDGLDLSGGSWISAQSVVLGGSNYGVSGTSYVTATNGIEYSQTAVSDPYASRSIPSFSGCAATNYSTNVSVTLNPGVYCGGISTSRSTTVVTLNPGVYILDQGNLYLSGGSTIKGTGVTIILTSSGDAGSIGTVNDSGGSTIQISAPPSGATAGIALWVDARAPLDATVDISGGSPVQIVGAIYAPSQYVNYSGGSATGGTGCTQLIVDKVQFSGGSEFDNSCAGTGTSTIGGNALLVQ